MESSLTRTEATGGVPFRGHYHGPARGGVHSSVVTPTQRCSTRNHGLMRGDRRVYHRQNAFYRNNQHNDSEDVSDNWTSNDYISGNSTLKPGDGYVQISSQLQLFPASTEQTNDKFRDMPEWSAVAQLVCISDEEIKCPICLNPPTAPRADRCGHIYCGPCVIRFIRYENDCSSKKCALCAWIMKIEELKRVTIKVVDKPRLGSKLSMKLVRRSKNSSLLAHKGHVSKMPLDREVDFVVDLSWDELKLRATREIELLSAFRISCENEGDFELIPAVDFLIYALSEEATQYAVSSSLAPEHAVSPKNCTQSELTYQYFYQAADGQMIFLDGLMWSCLLTEFKSVDLLPSVITVNVLSIKSHKMSLVSRKRWRHLDHIPLGHTFSLIEIDLDKLVSKPVLERFAAPIEFRTTERERRRLEDLHLTKLKEEAENRIPSLPKGFILLGPASLDNRKKLPFDASDFVPLCSCPSNLPNQGKPSVSFAEITKSGALNVVDKNRIATFARRSTPQVSRPFNPTTEVWPSLRCSKEGPIEHPLVTFVTHSDVPPSSMRQSASKRSRRRHSENSSATAASEK